MRRIIIVAILVLIALFQLACGSYNSHPPSYIKDAMGTREGDGMLFGFTLADANGQYTTADGEVTLRAYYQDIPIDSFLFFKDQTEVKRGDFGRYYHYEPAYVFPRVQFRDISLSTGFGFGTMYVEFKTTSGDVLKNDATFSFN